MVKTFGHQLYMQRHKPLKEHLNTPDVQGLPHEANLSPAASCGGFNGCERTLARESSVITRQKVSQPSVYRLLLMFLVEKSGSYASADQGFVSGAIVS